ncbi:MAG TPA: tyrosine--tRNA ligase, partial [Bryobacteraceae bacterium]
GITEPPKVMFRKVMGISDDLMWRYYELLTDKSLSEIEGMKSRDPMAMKMNLAFEIVKDFHSGEAAVMAFGDFDREVRKREVPTDIETVDLPAGVATENHIHLPKLLAAIGLTDSVSEANRKIKEGALYIYGARCRDLTVTADGAMLEIRLGNKWKRVRT